MAAKTYEIAFKLAGQISQKFTKTFEGAKNALKGFGSELTDLNKKAAQVGNIVDLRKEVGQSAREYLQAKQKVAELGKEISDTKAPTKKMIAEFNKAQQATSKAKNALDKKRATLKKLEQATGTTGASLRDLVKRQKELEDSADRARKAQQKLLDVTEQLDRVASAQAKASGVAGYGNTALLAGIKFGSETTAALNQLQAQTGATAQEMEVLKQSAMDLYSAGLGENFADVTYSLAIMRQSTGLVGEELENATKRAMILGDTFSFDINESARTSAALIKNFGITGEEAFDLIAYAAQNGANKNGDLLDTFNEYAVHYKTLGFSAEQFAQHLIEGAESGAWSIDKVGDMIKEFTIRSKDASSKSMEAFESLGLSGQEMTDMFAQGGASAQEAFFKVVEALNAIEDPVQKNAIGVALFGTMFEDLEANSLNAMLSLKDASLDTAGAVSRIGELQQADLGSQINLISRSFKTALTPAAQEAAQVISNKMPEIKQSINGLIPSVQGFAQSFTNALPSLIASLNSAIQSAARFAEIIMNNWSWIAPVLGVLIKGFIGLKIIAFITSLSLKAYHAYLLCAKAIAYWKTGVIQAKIALYAQKVQIIAVRVATIVATAATKAWTAAQWLFVAAQNGTLLSLIKSKIAMVSMKAAQLACTIATKAVTVATWLFNAALWANPITWIVGLIVGLIAVIVLLVKYWDKVTEGAMIVWDAIKTAWNHVATFTVKVFTGVRDTIAGIFSVLGDIVKAPINGVIGIVNGAISAINSIKFTVPEWVPGIGGKGWQGLGIPAIPMLAKGGIATGPTLAMIGEGREDEAVLPLSKLDSMLQGGEGGVINVNFAPNINVAGGGTDTLSQLNRGLRAGSNNLKKELERLLRDQRRVSYT